MFIELSVQYRGDPACSKDGEGLEVDVHGPRATVWVEALPSFQSALVGRAVVSGALLNEDRLVLADAR